MVSAVTLTPLASIPEEPTQGVVIHIPSHVFRSALHSRHPFAGSTTIHRITVVSTRYEPSIATNRLPQNIPTPTPHKKDCCVIL